MEQDKSNRIFSVDSETGIYWDGKQVLRHKALIKAIIEQEIGSKYAETSRSPLHFAVIEDQQSREPADATC